VILLGFLLREIGKKKRVGGWRRRKGFPMEKVFLYKDRERVFRDKKQIIIYGHIFFIFYSQNLLGRVVKDLTQEILINKNSEVW
jgi:hypothetical protein